MGIFLNQTDSVLFEQHNKSSPFNSTRYIVLYPQNGGRIVTVDSVASLRPMYWLGSLLHVFSYVERQKFWTVPTLMMAVLTATCVCVCVCCHALRLQYQPINSSYSIIAGVSTRAKFLARVSEGNFSTPAVSQPCRSRSPSCFDD